MAAKAGDALKKAFTVAAIVKGIQEVAKAVADCVNEFKKQIEVDTRLNSIIKATGQQYITTGAEMKEFARNLQDVTRFGDDAVESAASLLLATQKFSKEGLERTLTLSADVAEAMGTDLPSAASILERALVAPGEGLNRLKTIGITFTDTEKDMITELKNAGREFEAQQIILDKVEAAYGGLAKDIASIDTSTLDKIKLVWGDVKENLGTAFTNALSPVFDWIYKTLRWLERLTRQVAERSNLLKYLAANDVGALADNFTSDFLQAEIDKRLPQYEEALANVEKNNWLKYYLDKNNMLLSDFLKLSAGEQIDLMTKWSNNQIDIVSELNRVLQEFRTANTEIDLLRKAQQKIADDVFNAEELAKAAAAAAAADAAETAVEKAIDTIFSKYGRNSSIFNTRSLESDLNQVSNLLLDENTDPSDIPILEEIRDYLYSQQSKQNLIDFGSEFMKQAMSGMFASGWNQFFAQTWLGSSSGSSYMDFVGGYGKPGVWLTTTEAWIDAVYDWTEWVEDLNEKYGKNSGSGLGFNFSVPSPNWFETEPLDFSGAMELLGPEQVEKYLDFGKKNLAEVLKTYGSFSETYQTELIQETIESIEGLMSFYVEEGTDLHAILTEIITTLKTRLPNNNNGSSDGWDNWRKGFTANMEELEELLGKAGTAVLNDFTSQTGEFGDFVSRLVSNMTQFTPILGLIITALHYIIQGFVEVFGDMLEEFAYYGLEPLREIGRVIADILMPMIEEFMPSIQQSADILIQIFDAIGIVLKPIAVLIGTVLGPILKLITNFLEYILLPILKGIASVFLMVTSAAEFLADCVRWVVQSIKSWFGGAAPERVRSWAEIYEGHMEEMWMGTGSESSSYGVSGTTNASYQGSTTIYLNVYNQGTVVGDDGIQEFAIMIRDELANVAYYRR